MLNVMIRKKLMGLSFNSANLTASCRGLTNSRLKFVPKVYGKDNSLPSAEMRLHLNHEKYLTFLKSIVNQPEMDLESSVNFLKCVPFYEVNTECLKKLQNDRNFKRLCENFTTISKQIPRQEAIYILIQLCKLGINETDPLTVMRYWDQHIARLKYLSCIEMENLIVEVLGRSKNFAWKDYKRLIMANRLSRKFSIEEVQEYDPPSIISAFNLMKHFGFVDLRASEIFLQTLENQFPINWLQIFCILTHFDDLLPKHQSLLQQAHKHVYENIFSITSVYSTSDLIALLKSIRFQVKYGHLEFYDCKVVDAIVDEALKRNCCLKEGLLILNNISSLYHQHIPFLDYLIKKYEESDSKKSSQLVNLFSYAVRVNCDTTARILLAKVMDQKDYVKSSWITLITVVYYMSILDVCDQDLMETFCARSLLMSNIPNYKTKRLISWLKIFHPSFPLPKLVEMKFENFKEKYMDHSNLYGKIIRGRKEIRKNMKKAYPMKLQLESLFGGPEYVLTNLTVRHRCSIDHAVVFRQGGYPIAVNSNSKKGYISLNELSIPENAHIIFFQCVPWSGYVLNTGEVNGPYKMYIRCLKELKYNIVFLYHLEWNSLPKSERIPWLMRIIREQYSEIFKNEAYFV